MKVIFTVEISENLIGVIKDDLAASMSLNNKMLRKTIIDTARDIIADKNEDSVQLKPEVEP